MTKSVYIYAASGNLWPVSTNAPNLKREVNELWGRDFRRVNHYIELALFGAGQCINSAQVLVQNNCSLLLSTGQGNIHAVAQATQKIFMQNEAPMPVDFMHITNNMAGFYVAQALQLKSSNMTVSHESFPFESGLDLAMVNISSGQDKMCLLGAVDQCAYPLHQHRQRLSVDGNTQLAEGSHWFLLGNNEKYAIARCLDITYCEPVNLPRVLKKIEIGEHNYIHINQSINDSEFKQIQREADINQCRVIKTNTPFHDTASAYDVATFIAHHRGTSLIHINRDNDRRYCVLHIKVY